MDSTSPTFEHRAERPRELRVPIDDQCAVVPKETTRHVEEVARRLQNERLVRGPGHANDLDAPRGDVDHE